MWKIQTALIKGEIYYSLIIRGLFTEERKRCHKGTRVTRELLYIDQHIIKDPKMRRKNLAMASIDYKISYHMVRQSCQEEENTYLG